jgi:Big-like domain-containing protein
MLTDTAGNAVDFTFSLDESGFTLTLTPLQPLQPGQAYTVTLKGGDDAPHITDETGTPLAADYTWSFTTEPPPSPLIGSGNKFTRYHREILRLLADVVLAQYDVATFGEILRPSTQLAMPGNRVTAGGNLIAMRPDKQLVSLPELRVAAVFCAVNGNNLAT